MVDKGRQGLQEVLWKLKLQVCNLLDDLMDVFCEDGSASFCSIVWSAHIVDFIADLLKLLIGHFANWKVSHADFWESWLSVDCERHCVVCGALSELGLVWLDCDL